MVLLMHFSSQKVTLLSSCSNSLLSFDSGNCLIYINYTVNSDPLFGYSRLRCGVQQGIGNIMYFLLSCVSVHTGQVERERR